MAAPVAPMGIQAQHPSTVHIKPGIGPAVVPRAPGWAAKPSPGPAVRPLSTEHAVTTRAGAVTGQETGMTTQPVIGSPP